MLTNKSKTNKSKTSEYIRHANTAYQQGFRSLNYAVINDFLRQNNFQDSSNTLKDMLKSRDSLTKKLATTINTLDTKMKSSKRNITVYRGITQVLYDSILQTGILVNKSFTSTSLKLEQALKFGNIILKISVPLEICRYKFPNETEEEILFERNTLFDSFKLKNKNDKDDKSNSSSDSIQILLIECNMKKFIPPNGENTKTEIQKIVDLERENYLQRLKEEDDEIDWDNL
jgi:hypothetical protein